MDFVFDVLTRFVRAVVPVTIHVVREGSYEQEQLSSGDSALNDVREQLGIKQLRSVHVAEVQGPSLAAVYSPKYQDDVLDVWTCVIESTPEIVEKSYQNSKRESDAEFVVNTVDEMPDFHYPNVTVDNFPWNYWSIVRAAVRDSSRQWDERSGPASG